MDSVSAQLAAALVHLHSALLLCAHPATRPPVGPLARPIARADGRCARPSHHQCHSLSLSLHSPVLPLCDASRPLHVNYSLFCCSTHLRARLIHPIAFPPLGSDPIPIAIHCV